MKKEVLGYYEDEEKKWAHSGDAFVMSLEWQDAKLDGK